MTGGIIGFAWFFDAYLERVHTSAALPRGTRHLISPELAGKDVVILLGFLDEGSCHRHAWVNKAAHLI